MSLGLFKAGEHLPNAMRPDADAGRDLGLPEPSILSVSIELADHALRGHSLPRSAYAALVCQLYEGVTMGMPYKELMDFARNSAPSIGALRRAGEEAWPSESGPRHQASGPWSEVGR